MLVSSVRNQNQSGSTNNRHASRQRGNQSSRKDENYDTMKMLRILKILGDGPSPVHWRPDVLIPEKKRGWQFEK